MEGNRVDLKKLGVVKMTKEEEMNEFNKVPEPVPEPQLKRYVSVDHHNPLQTYGKQDYVPLKLPYAEDEEELPSPKKMQKKSSSLIKLRKTESLNSEKKN